MSKKTSEPMVCLWDQREKQPWDAIPGVVMRRVYLDAGDYTTEILQGRAVLERKSIEDFASSITHGRERFEDEIRRLRGYWRRAIIVEGEIGEVWRTAAVHPHSVIGSCASFLARSDCPVLFAGTRLAAARLAFGVLRRWEERLEAERGGQAAVSPNEGKAVDA